MLTLRVAAAALPSPPSADETTEVVFSHEPTDVPVTATLKVQDVFAASDPPVNTIVPVEAVVIKLSVPPHTDDTESVMDSPTGNTSVKAIPLSEVDRLGLLMLNVKVEGCPTRIDAGEKDFSKSGGAITVKESVAYPFEVLFSPLSLEEINPLTFSYIPSLVPVTVMFG